MSEQTAAAAPVNACNHWVLEVSASDVWSGRSLHGMQGVSGSNPLGSIEKPNPTFLLRQVGFSFWTLLGHRNGRFL